MPTNEQIEEMATRLEIAAYRIGPDVVMALESAAAMLRLLAKEREAFAASCTTLDELEAELETKQ